MKLKYKDIPKIKAELCFKQSNKCPICNRRIPDLKPRDRCLDHNHTTGKVRAVLCRSCNAIEGKVYKLFVRYGLRKAGIDYEIFLLNLADYIKYPETNYIHPKHKEKKVKK
ncbi:MAG TPA: endonuclease domain-containing protein [Allocoleopsis sp.]